jgi:hypothetical protein
MKWTVLFADTILCSLIFFRTPILLQAGDAILCASSALGLVAIIFPDLPVDGRARRPRPFRGIVRNYGLISSASRIVLRRHP